MREALAAARVEGCCLDSMDAELEGDVRESLGLDGFLEPGKGEDVGAKDASLLDDGWSVEMILVRRGNVIGLSRRKLVSKGSVGSRFSSTLGAGSLGWRTAKRLSEDTQSHSHDPHNF